MSDEPHDPHDNDTAPMSHEHAPSDADLREFDALERKGQRDMAEALYPGVPTWRRRNNTFVVQPADRPYLIRACKLAKAAAKTASKACELAECSQGQHEALTLEGYSDENIMRIEALAGVDPLELASGGRYAMMTGLRLYAQSLEKLGEKETDLFVDASGSEDLAKRIARYQLIFNHEQQRELPLDDNGTDKPYADDDHG